MADPIPDNFMSAMWYIVVVVASALSGGTIYLVTKIFPSHQTKIDELLKTFADERLMIRSECKGERAELAAEARTERQDILAQFHETIARLQEYSKELSDTNRNELRTLADEIRALRAGGER